MMIELIQENSAAPSVYRETIEKRGYGFHHWGVATRDFDRSVAEYEAAGHELAFFARVPTGGRVAYMDTTRCSQSRTTDLRPVRFFDRAQRTLRPVRFFDRAQRTLRPVRFDLPGMVELIELGAAFDEVFSRFYCETIGWDGREPVRAFA